MKTQLQNATLYGILDLGYTDEAQLEEVARALLEGGADILQLRAKGHDEGAIEPMARRVKPICTELGVPFIVNDFPHIAAAVGADGVHIGQDDGSLADVRAIVGDEMLVGRSTHSPEQAQGALEEGFDYIGFGPLFPTPTKKGRPGIGLENVAKMQVAVGEDIPMFCIGGIRRDNLDVVKNAGAKRIVIVSDLLTAPDVAAATKAAKLSLNS